MAARPHITITRYDHGRLEGLFDSDFARAFHDKPYLKALRGELDQAAVVDPGDVPPDVVTMYSTVRLRDLHSGELETYTLVYPEDADISQGKLSVLAPIGTAIPGYRVGDLVRWLVPGGTTRFRIEELVFQPERSRGAAKQHHRASSVAKQRSRRKHHEYCKSDSHRVRPPASRIPPG